MNNSTKQRQQTIQHEVSDPNELPFVKMLKKGKIEGTPVKEEFEKIGVNKLDYSECCLSLYQHVLENYNSALRHHSRHSLLDVSPESLLACFFKATKQGLSLAKPNPGCYFKVVEMLGSVHCTLEYTSKGLSQLLGSLGIIKTLYRDVVYEGDEWAFVGADKPMEHKVTTFDLNKRGSVACSYATAVFDDNTCMTVYVTENELKDASERAVSFAVEHNEASAWTTAYADEMRKTKPVYRLWKSLTPQLARLHANGSISKENFNEASEIASNVEISETQKDIENSNHAKH
jgi:recombinational DNA repair protein RecT